MVGRAVCFVESRVHEIGRVPIVHFFEVCGEVVPVGAEDIESSGRDYVVSIPDQQTLPKVS